MKKILFLVSIILSFRTIGKGQEFPQAAINNGLLYAHLYLPDAEKGYYRGTRFDWSGVMPSLEYQGHSYCGQWFPKYEPTLNDAIMGPVESFTPLGYKEAVPGSSFVQIGVGSLARIDGSPYSPFKYYQVLNPGAWEVKKSPAAIEFRHRLTDTAYSYDYTKKVALIKGRPELVLTHHLKNTGTRMIETDVYDHNFFLPDSLTTGPGFVLKFPFPLTAEETRGLDDLAAIRGDSIVILRQLRGKESVYAVLHGYGDQAADYDIRVENHITGTGIRIRSDRPLSRLVYWGSVKALCPEPYIHVKVQPGNSFTWTLRYEFYSCAISNGR
ncbi:MAG TPA: hypothetical protein VL832_27740 [Puia sp.]|nr:hypothetical protein [Puia sp.]